jgi:peptidoglycan/xylan/chitin deacetylase (PgdA/CDA1 family)
MFYHGYPNTDRNETIHAPILGDANMMNSLNHGTHVCITGDIDDFNTETIDCLRSYLGVLARYDVPATFFVTASAAENYPERLEFILRSGSDIQGHGDIHREFYDSVPEQTARLEKMIRLFSDLFDIRIEGFRAPWYRHDRNTYIALQKAGLKYDCSVKRFEIAFKGIPYIQRRYLDLRGYVLVKPILRMIGGVYNTYHHVQRTPYYIVPGVLEIPTLGISDYSLIGDPKGPRYVPGDSEKIGEIWIECLQALRQQGGGILNIQAHPGRMSPLYLNGLDHFISRARSIGAGFTSPGEIWREFSRR